MNIYNSFINEILNDINNGNTHHTHHIHAWYIFCDGQAGCVAWCQVRPRCLPSNNSGNPSGLPCSLSYTSHRDIHRNFKTVLLIPPWTATAGCKDTSCINKSTTLNNLKQFSRSNDTHKIHKDQKSYSLIKVTHNYIYCKWTFISNNLWQSSH